MIDERVLGMMPSHALLINTARGALVDLGALAAALDEKRLAGAGLDVFEHEPLPAEHALHSIETAVVTPHAAFYSEESLKDLQRKAAEQLRAALAGRAAALPGQRLTASAPDSDQSLVVERVLGEDHRAVLGDE